MANAPADPNDARAGAAVSARRLMRLARTAALATLDAPGGAPLTTLVGVASDWDGSPLMLMSTLSRHTRNLARDPRVSLLLTGGGARGDPLNHPRLTLGGVIEGYPEARAKVRYLQRNPKAALYAGFADFALYRLRIEDVHFNGGFGRAASRGSPATKPSARAGGRSASTPRASTSRPEAAPAAPSSLRPRTTRRRGGRVSRGCCGTDRPGRASRARRQNRRSAAPSAICAAFPPELVLANIVCIARAANFHLGGD